MAQDKVTIISERDRDMVVVSATYSDSSVVDGFWDCKTHCPSDLRDERTTQLHLFEELREMIDRAHEYAERQRRYRVEDEAKAKQIQQVPA